MPTLVGDGSCVTRWQGLCCSLHTLNVWGGRVVAVWCDIVPRALFVFPCCIPTCIGWGDAADYDRCTRAN